MTWLTLLLILKIIVTLIFVAIPLLFLKKHKLEKLTGISATTSQFFRLYGVAIMALLIGYSFGIVSAQNYQFPWGVVIMGLFSNTGAAFILLVSHRSKKNRWQGIVFGLIAIGLILALIYPNEAVNTIG